MSKDTVVVTSALPGRVEANLHEHFKVVRIEGVADKPALVRACCDAFGIVLVPGQRVDANVIGELPTSIRLLASYSVGIDHIDLDAARKRGVLVSNTPNVLTEATADLTLLLLLSVMRGASRAEHDLRAGLWTGWSPSQVYGYDLAGKTFGIVGFGRIGKAVAQRAVSFGLKVIFYNRSGSAQPHASAEPVSDWSEFLGQCDVVSLHAPSTPNTRGLIDETAISAMKPGAFLINTARGDLVVDDAVIEAAKRGHLAGVGLDVYTGEPAFDARYSELPNATLLPHIGSSTKETREAMGRKVMENLLAVRDGLIPPDLVS